MKTVIDEIIVDESARIRKHDGDIESLQNSIAEIGLINPVLIDENNRLVAGYRRLLACRNLGWNEIEATVVEVGDDQLKMLEMEVAENLHRQDFTPDEVLAAEKKRQEIIESLRKKSWWERFLIWLKKLFGAGSSETGITPDADEVVEDTVKETVEDRVEDTVDEKPISREKTEDIPKPEKGKKGKETINIFRTS